MRKGIHRQASSRYRASWKVSGQRRYPGSYDIFALYPESTAVDGSSYFQPQVARAVRKHNTGVAQRNRELDLAGVALAG
eukprot:scaffold166690_cov14-Tisochrysis_lutea.AAC.1